MGSNLHLLKGITEVEVAVEAVVVEVAKVKEAVEANLLTVKDNNRDLSVRRLINLEAAKWFSVLTSILKALNIWVKSLKIKSLACNLKCQCNNLIKTTCLPRARTKPCVNGALIVINLDLELALLTIKGRHLTLLSPDLKA